LYGIYQQKSTSISQKISMTKNTFIQKITLAATPWLCLFFSFFVFILLFFVFSYVLIFIFALALILTLASYLYGRFFTKNTIKHKEEYSGRIIDQDAEQ